MGRPRAIDQQMRDLVCGLVQMGFSRWRAARHVGIARATMYRTIKKDEQFARQLREAEMRQELSPLRKIWEHMGKDWRAAAWVAERLNGDEWGKRAPNTMTMADMHGLFGAMMKLALDGVSANKDRQQIMKNFDELFDRISKPRRCSPRVQQAIKELGLDQEQQQRARPAAAGEEAAPSGAPDNETGVPDCKPAGGEELESGQE